MADPKPDKPTPATWPVQKRAGNLIAEAEKERKAVAAVLRGYNYTQAAEVAGYTHRSGAYKAVQRVLRRIEDDANASGEQLRALEVARLDRALVEITSVALSASTNPDLKLRYLEAMRRNVESRAKLLNLYAPVQVEVFTRDAIDAQIIALSEQLGLPVPDRVLQLGPGPGPAGAAADPARPGDDQS